MTLSMTDLKPRHHSRIVRLEGARNIRDLGGLPTRRGATTRFGVIFRADGLSRLTEADLDKLSALKIRTIMDLREEQERRRAPDRCPFLDPANFYFPGFFPHGTDELHVALNSGRMGAKEAAAMMCRNYRHMPFEHTESLRDVLQYLLKPGIAPIIIHCTSGKDRTGLTSALVLSALDVPRDVILEDYQLSNVELQAIEDFFGPLVRKDAIDAVMAAHSSYLEAALDAIDERSGSMDHYLREALGFGTKERAALARLMLE